MNYIKVMGKKIKIKRDKDLKSIGEFNGDKNLISIRKGLTKKEEADTILHECGHAVLFYSGVSFAIDNYELEEAIVRAIEYNLLPLVREVYEKLDS